MVIVTVIAVTSSGPFGSGVSFDLSRSLPLPKAIAVIRAFRLRGVFRPAKRSKQFEEDLCHPGLSAQGCLSTDDESERLAGSWRHPGLSAQGCLSTGIPNLQGGLVAAVIRAFRLRGVFRHAGEVRGARAVPKVIRAFRLRGVFRLFVASVISAFSAGHPGLSAQGCLSTRTEVLLTGPMAVSSGPFGSGVSFDL